MFPPIANFKAASSLARDDDGGREGGAGVQTAFRYGGTVGKRKHAALVPVAVSRRARNVMNEQRRLLFLEARIVGRDALRSRKLIANGAKFWIVSRVSEHLLIGKVKGRAPVRLTFFSRIQSLVDRPFAQGSVQIDIWP